MKVNHNHVIGIVGGMGPQAGLLLLHRIHSLSGAATDQQQVSSILMSFPSKIVDRTMFLDGDTSINPAFAIADVIRKLEKAGATIVGMACNTSHVPEIYKVITRLLHQSGNHVKLLHMPLETLGYLTDHYPRARRVGVMSTNGVYKSGVYTAMLETAGYEVIVPDYEFQCNVIHRIIYDRDFGIKSHPAGVPENARVFIDKAIRFFKDKKADAVILGCTELSLALADLNSHDIPVIDSTEAFARALIRETLVDVQTVFP